MPSCVCGGDREGARQLRRTREVQRHRLRCGARRRNERIERRRRRSASSNLPVASKHHRHLVDRRAARRHALVADEGIDVPLTRRRLDRRLRGRSAAVPPWCGHNSWSSSAHCRSHRRRGSRWSCCSSTCRRDRTDSLRCCPSASRSDDTCTGYDTAPVAFGVPLVCWHLQIGQAVSAGRGDVARRCRPGTPCR